MCMYKIAWQADCIDMDCDGPRQALISDGDGTLLGELGAVLPRADKFSEGSFFGLPFKDEVNAPYMQSTFTPSWVTSAPDGSSSEVGWGNTWYPNVPCWCTGPVVGVRDRRRPLTNSRNVSDLVHARSSIMARTSSWARNSPRDQLLASPFKTSCIHCMVL